MYTFTVVVHQVNLYIIFFHPLPLFHRYKGRHNGYCVAYIGNTSNLDSNHYGGHCMFWPNLFYYENTPDKLDVAPLKVCFCRWDDLSTAPVSGHTGHCFHHVPNCGHLRLPDSEVKTGFFGKSIFCYQTWLHFIMFLLEQGLKQVT